MDKLTNAFLNRELIGIRHLAIGQANRKRIPDRFTVLGRQKNHREQDIDA
ncbi:hypothetical protein O4H49_03380 [Kiloniella laminariae]|uniref:Uncharacterized protein n=1 Tax=Kiloniella laminariae TaxID=454162 RepID=A0ABT4LFE4_9PROT|nr:hypothetical protein [Kiloniella laminariae]MCZ4279804.1 hypothetical protein [Kiloniella laminariae]